MLEKLFSPWACTKNTVQEDTGFGALMVFERNEGLVLRRKHYEKNTSISECGGDARRL